MANEKRLIDANVLIVKMCRACNNECCEEPCEPGECFMYDAINNAPTVDAVEVVHSRWVNIVTIVDGLCFGFCENCRTEQKAQNATALKTYHKYCRWCGAKMDGGNEDV